MGVFLLEVLGLWLVLSNIENSWKVAENCNFRFWISIYFQPGEAIAFGALYGLWGPYMAP